MPITKRCVAKGCNGLAMFGFGLASTGAARFACKAHRHMIWPAELPAAVASGEERRATSKDARSSHPAGKAPAQGALF